SDEPDDGRGEIPETGDQHQADAQGRHAGEAGHRTAAREVNRSRAMRRWVCLVGLLAAFSSGTAAAQVKGPAMPYPPRESEKSMPLRLWGRYQPEKAANVDPVAEASARLVGKATVPVRHNPVAFARMTTVPDPFENRNLLRVPAPVPEEAAPPL